MPPGFPPLIFPDDDPDPNELAAELQHVAAVAAMGIRHPEIPAPLLPDLVIYDHDLHAEYQALLTRLRPVEDAR